jgi:mannose-6-phosphate isomerase-like protein (cupin superfamily)
MSSFPLEAGIRDRRPPAQPNAATICWPPPADNAPSGHPPLTAAELCQSSLPIHYGHRDAGLGLDFQVHRLPFHALQALDPRLIRIPPGACNEKHRHAHESIFVVLEGEAEILVGSHWVRLNRGGMAHAPRWIVHQSRNPSVDQELLLLAITDFGLTSAVLGDYDRQTRLRYGGADAFAEAEAPVSSPGTDGSANEQRQDVLVTKL